MLLFSRMFAAISGALPVKTYLEEVYVILGVPANLAATQKVEVYVIVEV